MPITMRERRVIPTMTWIEVSTLSQLSAKSGSLYSEPRSLANVLSVRKAQPRPKKEAPMRHDVADGALNAGRWSVTTVMRNEASQRRGRQLCHGDLRRTDGLLFFFLESSQIN